MNISLKGYIENHEEHEREGIWRDMKEVWIEIISALIDLNEGYKYYSVMMN